MKQYYIIKTKKEESAFVEKTLLMCLVDRMNLCSIVKSIELRQDENSTYFVLGGEKFSCKRVLSLSKKILTDKGISIKLYDYEAMRSGLLDDLVWNSSSNSYGYTIKNYYSNPIIFNYIKRLTTKFVLKKGLLSKHVFCPECDGFADAKELNSLKGVYKCSFCNADVVVEGPILTGKKPIVHLSTEEQLYLIGKPNSSFIELCAPEENTNGEQMKLISDSELEKAISQVAKRRRRRLIYSRNEACNSFEQLSWNIIF